MGMTLHDMVQTLFAVKTRAAHSQVTVSNLAPPTLVVPNNPNRLSFFISNPGAHGVYLAFEKAFALGEGILLVPTGGFVEFLWSEDFDIAGWSMYGIADTAPVALNVLEIISL